MVNLQMAYMRARQLREAGNNLNLSVSKLKAAANNIDCGGKNNGGTSAVAKLNNEISALSGVVRELNTMAYNIEVTARRINYREQQKWQRGGY